MTGTNHALTGALIASAIPQPLIFVPLAITSHFVLDILPHFGEKFGERTRLSKTVWTIDFGLLLIGLLILIMTRNWVLAIGAFVAISPDLAWIFGFVFKEKWGTLPPTPPNKLNQFHANIQKLESRQGLLFEVAWFIGIAYLCARYAL